MGVGCCKLSLPRRQPELIIRRRRENKNAFASEPQVALATLQPGTHGVPFLLMEDPDKKLEQKSDGKPRNVRFKISSSYSGRVLKQVFEDGQELESPKEEYPHSFLQESLEPVDGVYGSEDAPKPRPYSPKLTAQRISVFREGSAYTLAGSQPFFNDYKANDHKVGITQGV